MPTYGDGINGQLRYYAAGAANPNIVKQDLIYNHYDVVAFGVLANFPVFVTGANAVFLMRWISPASNFVNATCPP